MQRNKEFGLFAQPSAVNNMFFQLVVNNADDPHRKHQRGDCRQDKKQFISRARGLAKNK
jgi:hypothetical protein